MSLFAKSSQMVVVCSNTTACIPEQPVLKLSGLCLQGAADALKTVAYLAPELILPDLLDRIYPALETLTETHQTVAAVRICRLHVKSCAAHTGAVALNCLTTKLTAMIAGL